MTERINKDSRLDPENIDIEDVQTMDDLVRTDTPFEELEQGTEEEE